MAVMSKRERVQATLRGSPADRVPVAFWRHWPGDDQNAEALTRVTLDYQHTFDWDFIKITPSTPTASRTTEGRTSTAEG
jgi:uroporphyrinogen decarboxylase